MITCRDIINAIEAAAPLSLACSWDNCGLIAGNEEKEVKTVLTCLDADPEVAAEAAERGADMILTHHPAIFHETKIFNNHTYAGRFLTVLLKSGICCYSAHTNLDAARGGLNDILGEKLGFPAPSGILEPVLGMDGLGRVYDLPTPLSMRELLEQVKAGLSLSRPLTYTGSLDRMISRAAICSGGGKGIAQFAIDSGADVYLTGDIDYDRARECLHEGMSLIGIEHYDSEILVCELFELILRRTFGEELTILVSEANKPVFHTYE